MEKSPKYSIILPIYNVESQIPRCIRSLISQTDQDFELILVDDGGTDRSVEIAAQMLQAAGRPYRLVASKTEDGTVKNQGAAAARNLGIREATGEWVQTLDSDDYLDSGAVALYKKTIKEQPDAGFIYSAYAYEKGGTERKPDVTKPVTSKVFYGNQLIKAFYLREEPIAAPACAVRKSAVEEQNLWYPEDCRFSEDMYFVYQLLFVTKKAVKLEAKLYHYVERENSTMTSSGVERMLSGYRKFKELDEAITRAYEKRTGEPYESIAYTGFGIDARKLFPRWILAAAHTASKVLPFEKFTELTEKMDASKEMEKLAENESGKVKTAAWMLKHTPRLFYTVMKGL